MVGERLLFFPCIWPLHVKKKFKTKCKKMTLVLGKQEEGKKTTENRISNREKKRDAAFSCFSTIEREVQERNSK